MVSRDRLYVFFLIFLCFIFSSSVVVASVVVDIREFSMVGGTYYTLGDIAKIYGGSRRQVVEISSLRLGISPPVGMTKRVSFEDIRRAVLRSSIDVREVVFKVPDAIVIKNAGVRVSKGMVYQAVLRYLSDNIPLKRYNYRIRLLPFVKPVVSAKRVVARVVNTKMSRWYVGGRRYLTVGFYENGRLVRVVNVGIEISFLQRLVVAKKLIKWHQIVKSSDVSVFKRWVDRWHKGVDSASAVVGKMATMTITPGTVITAQMVDVPPAIHRGDIVRIVSIVGRIVVVAKGKARQSGKIGEKIIVRNITSHRDVQGVVVDGSTVRVY